MVAIEDALDGAFHHLVEAHEGHVGKVDAQQQRRLPPAEPVRNRKGVVFTSRMDGAGGRGGPSP